MQKLCTQKSTQSSSIIVFSEVPTAKINSKIFSGGKVDDELHDKLSIKKCNTTLWLVERVRPLKNLSDVTTKIQTSNANILLNTHFYGMVLNTRVYINNLCKSTAGWLKYLISWTLAIFPFLIRSEKFWNEILLIINLREKHGNNCFWRTSKIIFEVQ